MRTLKGTRSLVLATAALFFLLSTSSIAASPVRGAGPASILSAVVDGFHDLLESLHVLVATVLNDSEPGEDVESEELEAPSLEEPPFISNLNGGPEPIG